MKIPPCKATALTLSLVLLLSGCNPASMMRVMASREDDAVAQYYIGLLRAGDFGPIERDMDPKFQGPGMHGALLAAANTLPAGEPTSVKMVSVNIFNESDLHQVNLGYEYQFSDKWFLINLATQKRGDQFTIIGLRVLPLSDSLENLNRFTLSGKSPKQYLVLIWGVATALFILYCVVLCARSKNQKRKWLWILFILFGFGQLAVDWTTRQWAFTPLAVNLFGFSAFASPYGPWIIKVSFPLGALIYLLRRRMIAPNDIPEPREPPGLPPDSSDT
jgi:hypothetical protein